MRDGLSNYGYSYRYQLVNGGTKWYTRTTWCRSEQERDALFPKLKNIHKPDGTYSAVKGFRKAVR